MPAAGCGAAVGRSEPQGPPWAAIAVCGALHRFEGPKPSVERPQKDFKIDQAKFYLSKK